MLRFPMFVKIAQKLRKLFKIEWFHQNLSDSQHSISFVDRFLLLLHYVLI